MIRFDANEIGSYTYKQISGKTGETTKYRISMRSGNCDSVHIYTYKDEQGEWWSKLFNFVNNAEHLRNMEKDKYDIFKNCSNIRLNVYFEQNVQLMRYATKFGHKVTCYYKELK